MRPCGRMRLVALAVLVLAEEARLEDDRVSYWLQDAMAASDTAGRIVFESVCDIVMPVCSHRRTFAARQHCCGCCHTARQG